MKHRDYVDGQTSRLLDQTAKQVTSGFFAPLEATAPAVSTARFSSPATGMIDQLTKQASEIAGTAIMGNSRLRDQLDQQAKKFADLRMKGFATTGPSISEQLAASGPNVFDTYFGTGPGAIGQALDALKHTYKPASISEALYGSKGLRSVYDTVGSSLSQMAAGLIDTKSMPGFGNTPGVVAQLAEKWRMANAEALTGLGNFVVSSRGFDMGVATASSAMGRALIGSASVLDDARVAALAQIELAPQYAAIVDEILREDEDAALVAVAMERRLIDRFKISRASAHRVVRVIIWLCSAAIMIGVTQGIPILGQVLSAFNDSLDLFSPREFSKKAAKKLIPLPEDERPEYE